MHGMFVRAHGVAYGLGNTCVVERDRHCVGIGHKWYQGHAQ